MAVPPKYFCIFVHAISFHHSPWIIKNQKKAGWGRIFYDKGNIRSILTYGGWFPSFEAHERRWKGLGLDRMETSDALLNSY